MEIFKRIYRWFVGSSRKVKALLLALLVGSAFAYDPNEDNPDNTYIKTWNSDQYKEDDGSITAVFSQGFKNFLNEDDIWETIDPKFEDKVTYWEMCDAPFCAQVPKFADGTAKFISNNKWDILENEKILEPPLTLSLTALDVEENVGSILEVGDLGGAVPVTTEYVVYENAYPKYNADLIYAVVGSPTPELKKVIRFNSNPNLDVDLKLGFELSYDKDVDIQVENVEKDQKVVTDKEIEINPDGKDGPRKIYLPPSSTWTQWHSILNEKDDPENPTLILPDTQIIDVEFEKNLLTKIIPENFFANTSYPFYTDAAFVSTPSPGTADGYAYWGSLAGETWTTARNQNPGTSWNNTDVSMPVGIYSNAATNEYENFWRAKAIFNTAALDDAAVINSVQISGTISFGINWFDDKLGITSATTASNTVVAFGDFPVANCGTTPFSAGLPLAAASFTENLNPSGIAHINKTGYTKFCFNSLRDIINSEPTWVADRGGYAYLGTSEGSGISLIVNYGNVKSPKKILITE